MTDQPYEEVEKMSDDLKIGDRVMILGKHMYIEKIETDGNEDLVLYLKIVMWSSMHHLDTTLVIPRKIPVTITKWI